MDNPMEPVEVTIWLCNGAQWKGPVRIRTDGSDIDLICEMYPNAAVRHKRPYRSGTHFRTMVAGKYLSKCGMNPDCLRLMQ